MTAAKLTQEAIEVLSSATPAARLTQLAIEVLDAPAPPTPPEVIPGNGLQSTLAAAITATDVQLTIQAADVPGWPTSGNYRCVICTDPTNGPWELVTVTGGQATAVLTVSRASETYRGTQQARAWASGATITPVITTGGLTALLSAAPYVNVQEQRASGINAGAYPSANTWQPRVLNTLAADSAVIASLGSGRVTLPPGTYRCKIRAGALHIDQHQIRLYNITTGAPVPNMLGSTEFSGATTNYATTWSEIDGQFTLGLTSVLELQHRGATANASTQAMGVASTFGNAEVYAIAEFWQLQPGGIAGPVPVGPIKGPEVVLSAPAPSVTLPVSGQLLQTYRNLRITWSARSDYAAVGDSMFAQLNGDVGNNYDTLYAYMYPSNAYSAGGQNAQAHMVVSDTACANAPAGWFAIGEVLIPNYASATQQKAWQGNGISPRSAVDFYRFTVGGAWRSLAPITSIKFFPANGNFVAGTVFSLYYDP